MPILNRSNTLNDMVVLRFLVIGIGENLLTKYDPVGAGLPAMAVGQSASQLPDPPPSQASQLPQGFVVLLKRGTSEPAPYRSSVAFDRWAGADQVAIAEDVVDATDRWPVLAFDQRRNRVHRLLAAVRVSPLADDFGGGVWRVFQRVVVLVQRTVFHCADFFADADHGVAEAVQFF